VTPPTVHELPDAAAFDPVALQAQLARLATQLDEVVAETRQARERWEVLDELVTDASPVMKQLMGTATERLDAMDLRRSLEFAGAGMGVIDRIVRAFGREDVEALGDNVVLMLQVVREMTQPEILGLLRQTATWANEHPAPAEPPSLMALAARMRKPEVRAGLDRVLSLLEGAVLSATHPGTTAPKEGPA
jgi:uncharacterized protein YjgD (DUF1641 family)